MNAESSRIARRLLLKRRRGWRSRHDIDSFWQNRGKPYPLMGSPWFPKRYRHPPKWKAPKENR